MAGRFTHISARWWTIGGLSLLVGLLAGSILFPFISQAEDEMLYVETTGHYISNEYGFLDYWTSRDGARLLGAPVTELLIENDLIVQYFERGRLEAHVGVDGAPLLLGHIGAEYASMLWLSFEPAPPQTIAAGVHYFEATRHTLREPFLSFWRTHEGLNLLGYPISELRWEQVGNQMIEVQYFERGRLEHRPDASTPLDVVQITNLGYALAMLRGYDTSPVGPVSSGQAGDSPLGDSTSVTTDTAQFAAAPVLEGATEPQQTFYRSSPSAEEADWEVSWQPITTTRQIVVDIFQQRLFAYDGTTLIYDAPISTGMDGFETPTGEFFIYARNPLQTMSGDLGGEYSVPNVPNSMYIVDDVAIHGTYWHNQFGTGIRRSHGCINLPLDAAAWLYNWSSVGTPVRVVNEAPQ